jgi:hypothetical protein
MSVRLPVGREEMMSGASNMSRDEWLFDCRGRRGIARGDFQIITNIFEMDNASGRWESAIWKGKQRYASIISSQGVCWQHGISVRKKREENDFFTLDSFYNLLQVYASNYNFLHVHESNLMKSSTFPWRILSVKRTSYCTFMCPADCKEMGIITGASKACVNFTFGSGLIVDTITIVATR